MPWWGYVIIAWLVLSAFFAYAACVAASRADREIDGFPSDLHPFRPYTPHSGYDPIDGAEPNVRLARDNPLR